MNISFRNTAKPNSRHTEKPRDRGVQSAPLPSVAIDMNAFRAHWGQLVPSAPFETRISMFTLISDNIVLFITKHGE